LNGDPAGWRYQLLQAEAATPVPSLTRRGLLAAGPLFCAAVAATPASAADARAAIDDSATVDIHSHAGSINGVRRIRDNAPFTPVADPMRTGGMAVACLAIVSDAPTHHVVNGRIHPFRDPAPGELYAFSQAAFARLHALIRDQGLRVITDGPALQAARSGAPSCVVAAEGGDFLEGSADRVDEAYARWSLRHLQLTHYRPNELGDIQTEDPVHGGLTDAGAEIIRRCNRRGLVVDLAHATYKMVVRAASVTTKPLVLSHTSLAPGGVPRPYSRMISADHARAIAGTGGVVGIWPPASLFPDKVAMAAGMARMVDIAGIDHVGLGSDMMGLVGPSTFDGYAELPDLAGALLGQGFTVPEVRKLLGGNYARVFAASMG
jgi:membrane dipeptidase